MRERARPDEDPDDELEPLALPALDWRRAMQRHPLPVLGLAALGGFFLGRRYGWGLLEDVSAFAADRLLQELEGAFEDGFELAAAEDPASGDPDDEPFDLR